MSCEVFWFIKNIHYLGLGVFLSGPGSATCQSWLGLFPHQGNGYKNPHKGSNMNEKELFWVLLVDMTLVKLWHAPPPPTSSAKQ